MISETLNSIRLSDIHKMDPSIIVNIVLGHGRQYFLTHPASSSW